jgi:uncharacterized membrane protein
VVIRAINIYGDPRPWAVQVNPFFTILSFVNTTKYAPSLLFTLMTLSFALGVLRLTDGMNNAVMRFFSVYGKVPLLLSPSLVSHTLLNPAYGLYARLHLGEFRVWYL